MHQAVGHHAQHSFGLHVTARYEIIQEYRDAGRMFFKIRMRRLLRAILAEAAAHQPDPMQDIKAQALSMERAAIAFGLSWHGFSPAQATLVIVQAAIILGEMPPAAAERLVLAAGRFAQGRGLAAFSEGIARDLAGNEQFAAMRQHRVRNAVPA